MVTWSVNADAQSCPMYLLPFSHSPNARKVVERASERALPLDGMTVFISFRERLRERERATRRRPSAAQCSLCLSRRTHARTATLDCAEGNSFGCCAAAAAAASVMTSFIQSAADRHTAYQITRERRSASGRQSFVRCHFPACLQRLLCMSTTGVASSGLPLL